MDWAQQKSDEDLAILEERITRVYSRALREVKKKLEDFSSSFFIKDKKKKADVLAGIITEEQYKRWRSGQFFIQGRWQALADELASDLANADRLAMSLTSENMVNTYLTNYNYGLFDVSSKVPLPLNFTAYNRDTVLWLIRDNPDLLPIPDPEKAALYDMVWNKNRITEELTQSILQGEDLKQLTDRLENVVGMDRNAAIRNARTLTTCAENKGRLDSYNELEKKGVPMFKTWLSTDDERTRKSHRLVNGQVRRLHEPFSNGLMFPADTSCGKPEEYYNCRCRLIANPYGVSPLVSHDENEKRLTGGRSFNQWVKEHLLHG